MGIRVIWNVPLPIGQPEGLGFNVNVPAPLFASDCIPPVMFNIVAIPVLELSEPVSWRFEIASPPGRITWPLSVVPATAPVGKQLDCCRTVFTVAFSALAGQYIDASGADHGFVWM
jgi:hypothetical protein